MEDHYRGRLLLSRQTSRTDDRWTVAVEIRGPDEHRPPRVFQAEDGIGYILEVEAAKESLNLGRRLIDQGRA